MINSNDCAEAAEYLSSLFELKDKDENSGTSEFYYHQEGLLAAAIVAYSRAFMDSRGKQFAAPKVKVNLGEIFGHNINKIKLHKLILEKRHKVVAHSEWDYRNSTLIEVTNSRSTLRKNSVVNYQQGIDLELFKEVIETMKLHFRKETFNKDVASVKAK
ncbi:MAG TPA: hypothetical protein VK967_04715 [Methylotenera sp.]|nr:hypothetical protein [Methylotenera sp.]